MSQWKKWFWKILTLNGLLVKKHLKKHQGDHQAQNFLTSQATTIDVNALIKSLGGISNISSVNVKVNVCNIFVHDVSLCQKHQLAPLGIKGFFISGQKINLVIGDDAHIVHQLMTQQLNHEQQH